MTEEPSAEADTRQATITFLTTEHFTLQGTRAASVNETNSRLQLYMGVLSSGLVALALVAQVSRIGGGLYAFAVVVLAVVYVLGLATIGRMRQLWIEWLRAGQGMARIRHYFVTVAPETAPYLTMPASDDAVTVLSGGGIVQRRTWWGGLVTAVGLVSMLNSVVIGVLSGVAVGLATDGSAPTLAVVVGAAAAVASTVLMLATNRRWFLAQIAVAEVAFPASGQE